MKKISILTLLFNLLIISSLFSQNIETPSEFLGYELGSRFTRHHKVVEYFKYVSKSSNNATLEKYGETNEFRPLYVSYISSEENLKNIENIRLANLNRTGIVSNSSNSDVVITWLSYNVHGNEASSTEAAMLTIYKLITEKQDWLKNTLVILDPCINPDGRDRYANWYNQTKSSPYNSNRATTEHSEPWPSGRANHYLFDLNRDWAWATQIETQQRLKVYNKWMPQIHVDFHEQGINNPYYFAPAAKPFHTIITEFQRDFQVQIGQNHAKHFDEKGWQYFTKESFDLLYPSYGDTYPTYMGAIGMTYEQAGSGQAGLGVITNNNNELTLWDRLIHHTTTGLSTVEMASKNSKKLVSEFEKYFDDSNLKDKSYVLRGDKNKLKKLTSLLNTHEIKYHYANGKTVKAFDYDANRSINLKTSNADIVVPSNQPKGKMVKVLFEKETALEIPFTYDITAWSLPFAYGLQGFSSVQEIGASENSNDKNFIKNSVPKSPYAFVATWNSVKDAAFLGDLLEEGLNVRFSEVDFSIEGKSYKKGTLVIVKGENKETADFSEVVIEIANRQQKTITAVNTGFVTSGADFGSSSVALITNKKIAVLSGEGTSSLGFGEIWHFFENQLKYPLHIINTRNFNRTNFSEFDVLILPNRYNAGKSQLKTISEFASKGGTVIAIGSSVGSFADQDGFALKKKKADEKEDEEVDLTPFDERENVYIKESITGSIFKSIIDNTHPLAYGYPNHYYTLKQGSTAFELLKKGVNVGYFSKEANHISGYAGEKALKKIPNSLLFGVENKGRGKIVYMVDNPLFRSFWENGKLFFVNAVFLN